MTLARVIVVAAFLAVLTLPFLVRGVGGGAPTRRPGGPDSPGGKAQTLVVVTPHVGQIRDEFGAGFAAWHARRFPQEPTPRIDWRVPGGTSEIIKQLKAEYEAAARAASRDGTLAATHWSDDRASCEATLPARSMGADLMFGGGHYEHDQLRNGITLRLTIAGTEANTLVRLSEPAGFDRQVLIGSETSWFRENKIGNQELFDPGQYWIGAALSAFGIVYNRELLRERGIPEPTSFRDLAAYAYVHSLALADPRQSGSVTTTYESILNKEGWDVGWRTLRELGANARSFASASTKPPVDVSQGDALAGLAIDFYGRAQAQAVMRDGEDPAKSRVGYVDPRGAVYIDADPVSVLHACPNPTLARRFIEFCLSEEGQALWQLPPKDSAAGAGNPFGEGGSVFGPERYALRRLPVRQVMYERYMAHFVDKVNPFEVAAPLPDRRWRSAIDVMMGAFAVDTLDELREAWVVLHAARNDAACPPALLSEMEALFYMFPSGADIRRIMDQLFPGETLPPDAYLDFSPAVTDEGERNPRKDDNCRRITAVWKNAGAKARLRVVYTEFFRANYRRVAELGAAAHAN
jgi:ABC-type Fe3+ transport system substrate-binding protein